MGTDRAQPVAGDAETATSAADTGPETGQAAPPFVPADACPFLIAAAGAYRMSVPDREHRCAAFVPATSLALSKQARLCLTANHPGCATYVASISARQARVGSGERIERAGRWGIARTMPIVEEVGGLRATLGALISDRRTWPAIPAVLLATLLLALGLSGSWGQSPITAIGSPASSQRATPTQLSTPRPTTEPTIAPSPTPSPSPTPAPTPIPTPSATTTPAFITYKVKSGDTLSGIASHFKTTVKAIVALNGITNPGSLKVGQILKIPTP